MSAERRYGCGGGKDLRDNVVRVGARDARRLEERRYLSITHDII